MLEAKRSPAANIRGLSRGAYVRRAGAGHGVNMENRLDPKELGRIKKAARIARIRTIRRRIAIFGATLAALFSGAVLVRSQLDQPEGPVAQATRAVDEPPVPGSDLLAQVSSAFTGTDEESDDHDSEDDSDDGGSEDDADLESVLRTATDVVVGSPESQGSPAPAPLTTSQS
jgi:hypothetical protein